MNNNLRWILIAPLAASSMAACSSNPAVDIGDPVGGALTDYAASWDGYAEAYQFADGSDRVRLVLDGNGTGSLRVGNAALLAPASDPNVGYPVGTTWDKGFLTTGGGVVAGFEYPVHGTRIQDSRIRIGVTPNDLYGGWCGLQTPVRDDANGGSYGCVGDWGFNMPDMSATCSQTNPSTQETVSIDCGKLMLCEIARVCTCTASACMANVTVDNPPVQLDAALSPDASELTGTLVVDGQRVTIRMHR
jgi:hypothetical protein